MNHSATYSPDDNKLRLYPSCRLDREEYDRVKKVGFVWAARQELFVAPMWTPEREDFLLEMCGEIEDEDKSLVERAEERAERFSEYSDKRMDDAERARAYVSSIADNIPLGQPILVGHHSERHARKDAERIENGMRRAVSMWETSKYWKSRAAGAVHAAKYKERPDVRARRIKGLEADKRKRERNKKDAETFLKAWSAEGITREKALRIANYDGISKRFPLCDYPRNPPASQYEGMTSIWSAITDGVIDENKAREISIRIHERRIHYADRWLNHIKNRLAYERAMLNEAGGIEADKVKPEKGGACKCWASHAGGWSYIQKVNKVSVTVLDNWGNGGENFTRTIPFDKLRAVMAAEQVRDAKESGRFVEYPDKTGFVLKAEIPDAEKIANETKDERNERIHNECVCGMEEKNKDFGELKAALNHGIKVVSAPQLFPTPPEIAARMVELAEIGPYMRVLEPSAGTGNILRAIGDQPDKVAVEVNPSLVSVLARCGVSGLHIHEADFLECNGNLGKFDRVVMNPPFENGADIKHVRHAMTFLNPGGRLVALCANGPRQREAFMESADYWEDLPDGCFKEQGTNVRVAMFMMTA